MLKYAILQMKNKDWTFSYHIIVENSPAICSVRNDKLQDVKISKMDDTFYVAAWIYQRRLL